MKILVCLKAIPNTDHGIMPDDEGKKIIPIMQNGYRLNAWDACAVEAAVLLKEKKIADTVHVITCGNPDTDSVLRRAMGMGADHGIHIIHAPLEEPDSLAVAKIIAETVQSKGGYDLILCGAMSEDRMEAATGQMIAALLGIPFAVSAVDLEILMDKNEARASSEMDGGLRQIIRLELPCLVTLQTGVNTPRYPKLSSMLKANQAQIETREMGSFVSGQKIKGYKIPEASRKTRFLEGSLPDKALELIRMMKEQGLLNGMKAGR